jgi:hypothetical protein
MLDVSLMSSWNRQPIKLQTKPGYSQKLPQGTFTEKTKPATVVSAYYTVKSRADQETYMQRMRLFLENIPCHLVFFTDESLIEFVKECRKAYQDKTVIIPLNRTEWVANIKYPETMWTTQEAIDPEADLHSTELYKLWYEKKEFVLTAIELNPFEHDDFVWLDAGMIREPEILALIKDNFPSPSRIPNDRILLLNVKPFTPEDEIKVDGITGNFLKRDRIAAGIIAGSIDSWYKWSEIYDETMTRYIAADRFIGKEQIIMSTMVLENKNLVSLINPPKNFGRKWFYSLIYLGVSNNRLKVINSFAQETIESYHSISSIPI